MFVVKDRRLGLDQYVFTQTDPRIDGCSDVLDEGVTLDYDMNEIHKWPDGQPSPSPQLGRDPRNSKHYKVFKFPEDLRAEGFEFVNSNTPFVINTWAAYRKHYFPVPEEYAKSMTQDEWFDFLEEADVATRLRKKLSTPDNPQNVRDRDQVAEWVAKRHMASDGGIQQIWSLTSGTPRDEIRLLEVSDRFTGEMAKIEPFDLGLDIEGAKYKLLVADISAEQLARIKSDPNENLPQGWKIDEARGWNRRGQLA